MSTALHDDQRDGAPVDASRRVRIHPGLRWLIALIVVPILLGIVAAQGLHTNVENNLQKRVNRDLLGHGMSTVSITVDGRDVTATVPGNINKDDVTQRIKNIEGVGNVKVAK